MQAPWDLSSSAPVRRGAPPPWRRCAPTRGARVALLDAAELPPRQVLRRRHRPALLRRAPRPRRRRRRARLRAGRPAPVPHPERPRRARGPAARQPRHPADGLRRPAGAGRRRRRGASCSAVGSGRSRPARDEVTRRRQRAPTGPTRCAPGSWSAPTAPTRRCGGPSACPPNPHDATAVAMRAYAPAPAGVPEQLIHTIGDGWPAYAWSFPIGDGRANIGFGMLRTNLEGRGRTGLTEPLARLLPGPARRARHRPRGAPAAVDLAAPAARRPGAARRGRGLADQPADRRGHLLRHPVRAARRARRPWHAGTGRRHRARDAEDVGAAFRARLQQELGRHLATTTLLAWLVAEPVELRLRDRSRRPGARRARRARRHRPRPRTAAAGARRTAVAAPGPADAPFRPPATAPSGLIHPFGGRQKLLRSDVVGHCFSRDLKDTPRPRRYGAAPDHECLQRIPRRQL